MIIARVTEIAQDNDDQGRFWDFTIDGLAYTCKVGTLPWRGGAHNLSSLAPGQVQFNWEWSQKHGCNLYRLDKAPDGQTAIEWHAANVMGDILKGWASQLEGCFAPGEDIVVFPAGAVLSPTLTLTKAQRGISASRTALAAFEAALRDADGNQQPFTLMIGS